jgi:hypothetical protein
MGKSKTFELRASFKRIAPAIECVGILKHHKIDDQPQVFSGHGDYEVRLGSFKAKKSAEDVLTLIHEKTSYTFTIQEKDTA